MRTPRPAGGCHQCCTSPSRNWRAARAQQVLAGEGRLGMHERHHVLQLVAEPVGPAGLIEARPAPEPAAQGLVQQPAVRHHVHGRIGRVHVYRAERPVPVGPDPLERRAARVRAGETVDQVLRLGRRCGRPRGENSISRSCPSGRSKATCMAAQGSRPGADLAGKARAPQRRRLRQASVPAQEFPAVPGDGARAVVDVDKRDAIGEFRVVAVAGQEGAGLRGPPRSARAAGSSAAGRPAPIPSSP